MTECIYIYIYIIYIYIYNYIYKYVYIHLYIYIYKRSLSARISTFNYILSGWHLFCESAQSAVFWRVKENLLIGNIGEDWKARRRHDNRLVIFTFKILQSLSFLGMIIPTADDWLSLKKKNLMNTPIAGSDKWRYRWRQKKIEQL